MGKSLIITEKPSVAREFAAALKENMKKSNGYMESEHYIITWCVGHLVTMCYPESYDSNLKRWSLDTIPFIPDEYKYKIFKKCQEPQSITKCLDQIFLIQKV